MRVVVAVLGSAGETSIISSTFKLGEITSYGEYFASLSSIFTWGVERSNENQNNKERWLKDLVYQLLSLVIAFVYHACFKVAHVR